MKLKIGKLVIVVAGPRIAVMPVLARASTIDSNGMQIGHWIAGAN